MSFKKTFLLLAVFLLLVSASYAADTYKPYLHNAKVPETPKVRMFGQYSTNLFPGSATYSYLIDMPKGVNDLEPTVFLSYNSQSAKSRPGILGAGWSLNQDLIYRDVNGTPDNTADDKFIMILDGNQYELVTLNGVYHTEVDYWFKIVQNTNNWTVIKQDGKKYTFGYTLNSSRGYTSKWFLSQVDDTHQNSLYYSYLLNPYAEDSNAVYLNGIEYNSDKLRQVNFTYETNVRSDRRRVFDQGNLFEESRRLTDITIIVDGSLIKRHHFTYSTLNTALSSLSTITLFGSDNSSSLFNISFDYYNSTSGFTNQTTQYKPIGMFSDAIISDYGFQLVDVNNDGFIDILQSRETGSAKSVWINDKNGNFANDTLWSIPEYFVHTDNTDDGVRFADINKDGYVDILKSKSGDANKTYLGNGTAFVNSTLSIPLSFVDSSGIDKGVQIADLNGDGRPDLIKSKNGEFDNGVYLNTGSEWTLTSSWNNPAYFIDTYDIGVRLIDINGDGLPDLLKGGSTEKKVWLNNGTGFNSYDSWAPPISFVDGSGTDLGVRFSDANGDGLVDILNQSTSAYLNNGVGWTQDNTWKSPDDFIVSGKNVGRRLADVDGDGFVDIVISYAGVNYTLTKNTTTPYMLKSVKNEYGGTTLINYTKSTQFVNDNLGFNIFVVNSVVKNNSMSLDFITIANIGYNYSNGRYNYDKSEFRGFGISTEFDNDSVSKHYFLQDDARRGKRYQTEAYDLNNILYSKNIKNYNYTYANGVYNLSLISSTDFVYDGQSVPKIHNISYSYNVFGNPQFVTDYGDNDITGDEKYYNYSYGFNFDYWIINKVSRMTSYDANMNKIKETKYYYDSLGLNGVSSKGELTKTEDWLEGGNDTYSYLLYDSFGNLIQKTDNFGNTYKYKYEKLNIFLDSTINPLGYVTVYNYNAGTGNLNYTEINGIRTYYQYDVFGRILKEIKPYDSEFLPTKAYVYSFDGVAPEKIIVKQKTTANNTDNANFFYDGFGNIIQIKQEIENNQVVVKNIFYDQKFRVGYEQNPYFANYSSSITSKSLTDNITTYNYDTMGRVIRVVNSDGSNKTVTFNQYNITDFDENGHMHTYSIDAYGRIITVYEYNKDPYTLLDEVYTTKYDYDANDNLIKITDNENNEFQFFYDALGRKTKMIDPDMGTWTYQYDQNGNLISQSDNKGNTILLTYDSLNRIKTKTSSDVNTSFAYDKDYYGTLSNITIGNNVFTYTYDSRFRVIKETQNINGTYFENNFVYDSSDKLISNNNLSYIFNKQGKVNSIPNYVLSSFYNSLGSILNKTYTNSISTSYSYRSDNGRLTTIISPTVQSLAYSYDAVGNIMSINDSVNNRLSVMSYDSLDRLITATIGANNYAYAYNSIGNIKKTIKNNQSKKYVYNGLAHAPSRLSDGGVGIDLYNPHDVDSDSKSRVLEFYLVNEKNTTTTGNFSVDFGDASAPFNYNNLNVTDHIIVFVKQNYTKGGSYVVNFTANSSSSSDSESESVKFGTYANAMNLLYSNINNQILELVLSNNIKENVTGVRWNCSEGLNSPSRNISGNASEYDYISYTYTSGPGKKTFSCNITSDDGNDTISKDITIRGLEVEEYDVLSSNVSTYISTFNAKNYYNSLATNIKISTNNQTANYSLNISPNENIVVFSVTNYTSDGNKEYKIDFTANGSTVSHVEDFLIQGVSIQNYQRIQNNYTDQILLFDVMNNWKSGAVNFTVTNPDISNSSDLNNSESIAVIIENGYTSQGNNNVGIRASSSTYTDFLTDSFEVSPLQIMGFEALTNSVFEITARNNLNSLLDFNWALDEVVSNYSMNITAEDAYIIVEKSLPSNVQVSTATINSTSYIDSESEVVTT